MGGATETTATRLGEVGALYGEMIQLSDDLNDVMEYPANVDWLQGRYPLPILRAWRWRQVHLENSGKLRHLDRRKNV